MCILISLKMSLELSPQASVKENNYYFLFKISHLPSLYRTKQDLVQKMKIMVSRYFLKLSD